MSLERNHCPAHIINNTACHLVAVVRIVDIHEVVCVMITVTCRKQVLLLLC
jgi:hypothetical protein